MQNKLARKETVFLEWEHIQLEQLLLPPFGGGIRRGRNAYLPRSGQQALLARRSVQTSLLLWRLIRNMGRDAGCRRIPKTSVRTQRHGKKALLQSAKRKDLLYFYLACGS
jgi:hypothetical protein